MGCLLTLFFGTLDYEYEVYTVLPNMMLGSSGNSPPFLLGVFAFTKTCMQRICFWQLQKLYSCCMCQVNEH